MWMNSDRCVSIMRYLRCMQRYLHHAMDMPSDWPDFHSEYVDKHRSALVAFIGSQPLNKVARESAKLGSDVPQNSYSFWPNVFLHLVEFGGRASRNAILRMIGWYWIEAKVIGHATGALKAADEMLKERQPPALSDVTALTRTLGQLRWEVGSQLLGTSLKDSGDIWPTDEGESGVIRCEWMRPHLEQTSWQGKLSHPTVTASWMNPCCGDRIWIEALLSDEIIQQVRFRSSGCIVCRACTSLLCKNVEGLSIDDVISKSLVDLLSCDISEITINRRVCARVGYNALLTAIESRDA